MCEEESQFTIGIQAKARNGVMLKFREDAGIVQVKAAELAGVSASCWCAMETMKFKQYTPGSKAVEKIAEFIGCAKADIYPPEFYHQEIGTTRTAYKRFNTSMLLEVKNRQEERLLLADPSEEVEQGLKNEIILRHLKYLTYREREILKLRYGLSPDGYIYTYREIGEIFKVTRERIRVIEAKALRKLKKSPALAKLIKDKGKSLWGFENG